MNKKITQKRKKEIHMWGTSSKLTLAGLILTLMLAVGGWVFGINNKLHNEELKTITQKIEQESMTRKDADDLASSKIDDLPDKVQKVLESQSSILTKLDIIMHQLKME